MQVYGYVEVLVLGHWQPLINISSLLLDHSDLNGCLFGVDNYAGYVPLFPERGLPVDASIRVSDDVRSLQLAEGELHESWVSFSELKRVDWDEPAADFDQRITELVPEGDNEVPIRKWLQDAELEWVRDKLYREPAATVRANGRVYRRLRLTRKDSLWGTEFPLLMALMETLAKRFGDTAVRLVVWFG